MLRRSQTLATVLALMTATCAGEASQEPTTTAVSVAQPSKTIVESTTTPKETTSPAVEPVVLGELVWAPNTSRKLREGVRHRAEVSGVAVEVTPPAAGWSLLGLERSAMLMAWGGPSGFRNETLNVLVFDVGNDGVDAAWARTEALLDSEVQLTEESWAWTDEGTTPIAGIEVAWREMRVPEVRPNEATPRVVNLSPVGRAALWAGTSARVFVVPVDDLTVTVVGYETRCACSFEQSWARSGNVDDEENELSMWVPELDALRAAMALEAP